MRTFLQDYPRGTGRGTFAPDCPDYVEDVVLAAATLQRILIPPGARYVVLSFDADVRMKVGVIGTALTLPAVPTSDGTGSELNPSARRIPEKLGDGMTTPTHICLISASAAAGSLSFYG